MAAKYAVVFPGQGSQKVGMLDELHGAYRSVRDTFDEAGEVLGYDLWQLVANGPAEELNKTRLTQPVMHVCNLAIYRLVRELGAPAPAIVAGHSVGEYAALAAAEVFSFADSLRVVAKRAQLMNTIADRLSGGMVAIIGLPDPVVVELCQGYAGDGIVEAVNFNAPMQVVIAGHDHALDVVAAKAREAGARKCVRLPLNVPNHSSLMQPVVQPLIEMIDSVSAQEPIMPVVQNFEARPCQSLADIIPSLHRHVVQPVHWTGVISCIASAEVDILLESGPGSVLTGLIKRIDRDLQVMAPNDPNTLEQVLKLL